MTDAETIQEQFHGSPELLRDIAVIFLESYPDMLKEVRDAIEHHDAPAVRQAAHKIKGSLGNFMTEGPYRLARTLEHMGRDEKWEHIPATYQAFEEELNRLETALKKIAGGQLE